MENMESQLKEYTCTESAQGQTQVNGTLRQLEAAKIIVESLGVEASKFVHDHNSDALGPEVSFFRHEVGRLRCIIESVETKLLEEQIQNTVKIRNAYQSIELIKSESSHRESELKVELKKKQVEIEDLKAKLMDDKNKKLNLKVGKSIMSPEKEYEIMAEFQRMDECVAELNGDHIKKERALQSISEENEIVKYIGKAMMKLEIVKKEAEKSKQNAKRLAEQLEVVQAAMSETKAEVRRLREQSDQWRKVAEDATTMIYRGNNGQLTERSLSLDNGCNTSLIRYPFFSEENDDGFQRKKSGNFLEKIKGLWKKIKKE